MIKGKDVRVCIIGKEIAFAYERKNNNEKEFRSNIEKGGERKLHQTERNLIRFAYLNFFCWRLVGKKNETCLIFLSGRCNRDG